MGPAAQMFLDMISMSGPLIFDWRQCARACLSPAQVPVWETLLRDEAERQLLQARDDPNHPLHGAQIEMLIGQGPWLAPQDQVGLPVAVLMTAASIGRSAFEKMRSILSGSPSCLHIRQKQGEHFGFFANRVQTAIAASSLPAEAQDAVFRECLRSGALPVFKAALAALPGSASVGELIQRGCELACAEEAQPLIAALQAFALQ